ncbi:phage/plasmid primase, P4 family [Muricoccus radiodurans]|uniref:phage/plasmid primase, P4 family n=1 Tax=Muricoccus radiodurans TaxID=2231721 RepID=UPI003CE9ADF0
MNAQTGIPPDADSGWSSVATGLDQPFALTFFPDYAAASKREEIYTLRSLAPRIQAVTAATKKLLPWLKMARFGDRRTDKVSLRHDANILTISGIEADYDGESVAFDEAVEIAAKAGLLCLIYTSPSHTPGKPRWRILCPTSGEMSPEVRQHLLGRLNGLFGGIFSDESWTLSQSYYYGKVGQNPEHQVEVLDGIPIDQLDELDSVWRGKPNAGSSKDAEGKPRQGPLNEAELLQQIRNGLCYHAASVRLLGRWARQGVPYMEARRRLVEAMETVPEADRDSRWQGRFTDIDRCLEDIYVKEASAKDRGDRDPGKRPPKGEDATSPDKDAGDVPITEDSVAAAFARKLADTLRYCHHAGRWYRWSGSIWQREETRLAFSWARHLARRMAAATENPKVMVAAGKASFASGVERLAQADRTFAVTSATWDQDPWLLGTPGGTVDLRTGELRPARQEDHISRTTTVSPAERATCPLWLAFLWQATGGDEALIGFLQRWFGYTLTGVTREHALLFVYGPGGNGKGVLLVTVAGILGTYATNAAMDTFTASQSDRHPTDLAMLHGARMVMTTETEEGRAWAESRIKALTGGDPITARFMRQDYFTFVPAFKLTISGNHKPALRNVDDAARRRFNVVPFLHKPVVPDKHLTDKLQEEWPGILRWLIDGCLAWQKDGLQRPRAVLDATAEYFAEQDLLAQWVEECCDTGRGFGDTSANLFASWRGYAQSRADEPHNAKWFATMLERQGFQRTKDCQLFRGRGFLGIQVKPGPGSPHWSDRDP